jgi:amidase
MSGPVRFIDPPSREEIRQRAVAYGIDLSDSEVDYIDRAIRGDLPLYRRIERLPDPETETVYTDRDPGSRPGTDEDPYNAFVTRCRVSGADEGPLDGLSVGLKDNIAVAGVETTVGSPTMDSYVPGRDATVVTRLLDAGATITAKLSMTPFSVGDSFHDVGRNPRDPARDAGASSTGSAIAVVTGDVDVALGGDQGGSIRQPAAWCGCVGLKPTRGLVPYTGVQGLEDTIDSVGPMATSAKRCARTLEAIAGYDPLDPRQERPVETDTYTDALGRDVEDLTVGVLEEGFETGGANEAVHGVVRDAIDRLADLGATVTDISVPWHPDGAALSTAIITEGMAMKIDHDGLTPFTRAYHDVEFADAFGKARRVRGDDISLRVKARLVFGDYLGDEYQHRYYGRAQNLARDLTDAYDEAFEDVDVLALPTWNDVAPERPGAETYEDALDDMNAIDESWEARSSSTTSQFNVSGHPALSVPCGTVDDLPVGLQLVGARFDERTLFRVADAFERAVDWTSAIDRTSPE